jgi:hypothetical protein
MKFLVAVAFLFQALFLVMVAFGAFELIDDGSVASVVVLAEELVTRALVVDQQDVRRPASARLH